MATTVEIRSSSDSSKSCGCMMRLWLQYVSFVMGANGWVVMKWWVESVLGVALACLGIITNELRIINGIVDYHINLWEQSIQKSIFMSTTSCNQNHGWLLYRLQNQLTSTKKNLIVGFHKKFGMEFNMTIVSMDAEELKKNPISFIFGISTNFNWPWLSLGICYKLENVVDFDVLSMCLRNRLQSLKIWNEIFAHKN